MASADTSIPTSRMASNTNILAEAAINGEDSLGDK
jgi:hypothetical protein